tara:strand:+ start:3659 stop:4054 length:396 start_codon:yes stop_codon:yes gene_type:complete
MISMPDEPFRGAKGIFPQIWCEWGSIALAEVLATRGFGQWTFVSAKLPESLSGHAWLELRCKDGDSVYSVDVTLDQFPEWNEFYVGPGRSPASTKFTQIDYVGPWEEWPVTRNNDSFARYADIMLDYLNVS